MKNVIRVVALFFCCIGISHGASFDCQKASTTVDKLVCDNQLLSGWDTELDNAYHARLIENPREAETTKNSQGWWVEEVRNKCQDKACLFSVYPARIKELSSIALPLSTGQFVVNSQEFAYMQNDFKTSLSKEGIALKSCSLMVRLDRPRHMTGDDESYGAFCVSTTNRGMMVCDDTLVGKLTVSFSYSRDAETLLTFIRTNCPQGG